jgi:hypothetical protein
LIHHANGIHVPTLERFARPDVAWYHTPYNFEEASHWLGSPTVRRLVFFWDHPALLVEEPEQLAIVGGFFWTRSNDRIEVQPLSPARGLDPHRAILDAAGPDTAILWLYDLNVRHTAAALFPPRIELLDPAWECRNFGESRIGILACRRRP